MDIKEKVKEIISQHNLMHVATIKEDGTPALRGVDYVNGGEENVLYFVTRKDSNKVQEIKSNNKVAVVIDHDCPTMKDLQQLKYLKASAFASTIDTMEEAHDAIERLTKKFPFLADLPGDKNDFLPLKLELKEVYVTDNSVGFGHTEVISY